MKMSDLGSQLDSIQYTIWASTMYTNNSTVLKDNPSFNFWDIIIKTKDACYIFQKRENGRIKHSLSAE